MTGPSADDLTDTQAAAITAACDEATGVLAELTARDPSVVAARTDAAGERQAAVRIVRDAYLAVGVDGTRADRAATVWLIEGRDPRYSLRVADAGVWRAPGQGPGGLGQS